jgi:hypothetical protein
MIASAFFYFSLLTISWMSFVRALTAAQRNEINGFLNDSGGNFYAVFHTIRKRTLDAYFGESILNFQTALRPYLNNWDIALRNGQNPAPPPGNDSVLNLELAGLTNFVNLIKYYNLYLLSELKWNVLATYRRHVTIGPGSITIDPASILGMIDDAYVTAVWNEYSTSRINQLIIQPPISEQDDRFRTYMIHIATLYSMNATMLGSVGVMDPPFGVLVDRLLVYHAMIIDLQSSMARYMQIKSLSPYYMTFMTLENNLNELATSVGISDTITRIRDLACGLSNHILSVIAIYGCPHVPEPPFLPGYFAIPGTEILFKLFETQPEIRRLIGQRIGMDVSDQDWILGVLRIFDAELLKIEHVFWIWKILYGPNSGWLLGLRRMVNTALYVLDPPAIAGPSHSYYPPQPAGPSAAIIHLKLLSTSTCWALWQLLSTSTCWAL